MRIHLSILILCAMILGPATAWSLDVEEAGTEKIYVPDYVRAQFAGDFGLLSAGPGYSFFDRHLAFDLGFGYTPLDTGGSVFQGNAEVSFDPIQLDVTRALELHPIRAGVFLTYLAGSDFWTTSPDRFDGSYGFSTSWVYGPSLGGGFFLATSRRGILDAVDVYWRASYNNLHRRILTENADAVRPLELVTLGFGVRLYL